MNDQAAKTMPKIIRLAEVIALTGYSRSSIYLKIAQGNFPPPIALGSRSVVWLESDIIDWVLQHIEKRKPFQRTEKNTSKEAA